MLMPKLLADTLFVYFPPNGAMITALVFALAGAFFMGIYFLRRRKK